MQYINNTELLGVVGNIRKKNIGGAVAATVQLTTQRTYTSKDQPTVENAWHLVSLWDKDGSLGADNLKVGDVIHVTGPIRYRKYLSADGVEKIATEIHARTCQVCDMDGEKLEPTISF